MWPYLKNMAFSERLREGYRFVHTHEAFYRQLLVGAGVFIISILANIGANIYASQKDASVANDILLDLLPVVNMDYLYVEGAALLVLFTIFLAFYKPQRLPFMLKSIGLFILIRSFFVMLTHLSLPLPGATPSTYQPFGSLTALLSSGNDLFFSGHTGFPFLLALIFWKDRLLRYLFLATALFFGTAVLLGHLHYSIDVFAAFFITYAIYDLSVWLFIKDHTLFHFLKEESLETKTPASQ